MNVKVHVTTGDISNVPNVLNIHNQVANIEGIYICATNIVDKKIAAKLNKTVNEIDLESRKKCAQIR